VSAAILRGSDSLLVHAPGTARPMTALASFAGMLQQG
jgi:hypothetical protein